MSVSKRIQHRWKRPAPELMPAIDAFTSDQSPHYHRFRPIVRPETHVKQCWSSSSILFRLPVEILERILYYLAPDLSKFALVNSDCQYLARPSQFRCMQADFTPSDLSHQRKFPPYDQSEPLLPDAGYLLGLPGLAIAPYIRYLELFGGSVNRGMRLVPSAPTHWGFSVRDDLVAMIPQLINLETLSHRMRTNHESTRHILYLTLPYVLALTRSPVKNLALADVRFDLTKFQLLKIRKQKSWRLESLIIKAPMFHRLPPNIVPSVFIKLCSKTLKRLTLDCANALTLFSKKQRLSLPAIHALYLDSSQYTRFHGDPNPGDEFRLRTELMCPPAVRALRTTMACPVTSTPSMKRYASHIRSDDDLEQLAKNLGCNSQLESLNITFEWYAPWRDTVPMTLINSICQLPHLQALRIDGGFGGRWTKEALSLISAMSTLRHLHLLVRAIDPGDLRDSMRSGTLPNLEFLSVDPEDAYDLARYELPQFSRLPSPIIERISLYNLFNEAELFAAVLPSLRACILGTIPFKIVDGKAQALLARPCANDEAGNEIDQLLDHTLSIMDTHLWRLDCRGFHARIPSPPIIYVKSSG